jgi:tRNA(fMet)-specific endonuclease VapC
VAKLILDTGVLIAGDRGQLSSTDLADDDDLVLPAVAVAGYLAGVILDRDPARQAAQRGFVADILATVPICDCDRSAAEQHAELLAHVHRLGEQRRTRELVIAATARANNRAVLTTDARSRFDKRPGVSVRLVAR